MTKYDSILKEKKKYKDPLPKEEIKKFPKFKITFILSILVIIISYIVYLRLGVLKPVKFLSLYWFLFCLVIIIFLD